MTLNCHSKLDLIGAVPHNNFDILNQSLGDKMVIDYALEAAQDCELINNIHLPAQISSYNLKQFSKVKNYYSDHQDALSRIADDVEGVCILNLANPQLKAVDITSAAKILFENSECQLVESIIESDPVPGRIWKLEGQMVSFFEGSKPFERRQDQEKGYLSTKDLIISRRVREQSPSSNQQSTRGTYGYQTKASRAFKINDKSDLLAVRSLTTLND